MSNRNRSSHLYACGAIAAAWLAVTYACGIQQAQYCDYNNAANSSNCAGHSGVGTTGGGTGSAATGGATTAGGTTAGTGTTYNTGVGALLTGKCAIPGCHVVGGTFPPLDTYANANAKGVRIATRVAAGTMPPGGLGPTDSATIAAWATANFPQ